MLSSNRDAPTLPSCPRRPPPASPWPLRFYSFLAIGLQEPHGGSPAFREVFAQGGSMFGKTTGRVVWVLAVAGLFLIPAIGRAEIDFGVRGGFYSDADAGFLGGALLRGVDPQSVFYSKRAHV